MPSSPKIAGQIQISNVAGSTADPPDPAPFRIDLTGVQPGSFVEGTGGGRSGVSATVITRIDGSDSGLFSVVGLEVFRLERDPDAPKRSWQSIGSVDGGGPIGMGSQDFITATVRFACPSDPAQDTFDAVVHVSRQDDQTQSVLSIPIRAALPAEGVSITAYLSMTWLRRPERVCAVVPMGGGRPATTKTQQKCRHRSARQKIEWK